jgi:hypothetical protein
MGKEARKYDGPSEHDHMCSLVKYTKRDVLSTPKERKAVCAEDRLEEFFCSFCVLVLGRLRKTTKNRRE